MDESYTLSVQTSGKCLISAPTFVGAMYAMETLSQLVLSTGGSLQNHTQGHPHAYWIPDAPWDIQDHPRFQVRCRLCPRCLALLLLRADRSRRGYSTAG